MIEVLNKRGKSISGRINAALEKKYGLDPIETGLVLDRLYVVNTDTANFYVYLGDGGIICFDTGYRPQVIKREMKSIGIDPDEVTHVFLSHADLDHVGGLGLFKKADVYMSVDEERMIKGLRSPRSAVRSPRIWRRYHLLGDSDTVVIGNDRIRAIATPGHTPGSMAYLLNDTFLFLGDTCKLRNGEAYAGKHYTMDYEMQKESIRKLAKMSDIGCVLTGHSGYTEDFDKAFNYWR